MAEFISAMVTHRSSSSIFLYSSNNFAFEEKMPTILIKTQADWIASVHPFHTLPGNLCLDWEAIVSKPPDEHLNFVCYFQVPNFAPDRHIVCLNGR